MNKNRKSKLVLFSVIGLAAVSIGTVGFATWVVGVQHKTESLTVTALVDNTKNSSVYLEAATDGNPVKIAEKAVYPETGSTAKDWDIVTASTENGASITVDPDALQFKFNTLKYSYGNDATVPTQLSIKLLYGESENVANLVSFNEVGRSGASWRYLEFEHVYTLVTDGETDLENNKLKINDISDSSKSYRTFEVVNKVFTLEWGSYFGNTNPVAFYNSLSKKIWEDDLVVDKTSELFDLADKAYSEITRMNSVLTTGSPKLTVEVSIQ